MQTASMIKPRVAFVGVGWIGRNRLQSVEKSGLAQIDGISDTDDACIAAAKELNPELKTYSSYQEIIDDNGIDAVVIATPSALHMQQSVDALKKGKAVFCQKPIGRNGHEVRNVVNTAYEHNRLLGADFSYRYTQAFQKIHETIRSGELGKIFATELKFHNAYGPGKSWFYDLEKSGGGCVLDLGVHLIDLLLYTFDFPLVTKVSSALFARGQQLTAEREAEDYASIQLELQNDVQANISCSWNLHAGSDAIIEAAFYGTNGGVEMKNVNGSFYDFDAYRYHGTKQELLYSGPDDWGGKAITEWLKKLSASKNFSADANSYLPSALAIDQVYGLR